MGTHPSTRGSAGAPGSRRVCVSPALRALCWEQWDPQPHGQLFAPQHWEQWMPGMDGGSLCEPARSQGLQETSNGNGEGEQPD